MKILSTSSATTVGGRDGTGSSEDGKLNLEFALPKELGGKGKEGITPEHLFAQGYSACYGSALQFVAGQKKITLSPDFSVTVKVDLNMGDDGFSLNVELIANLPGLEKAQVEELMKIADTV